MNDTLHELCDSIYTDVHALVDKLTKDLTPGDDLEVREMLNETFRFWR